MIVLTRPTTHRNRTTTIINVNIPGIKIMALRQLAIEVYKSVTKINPEFLNELFLLKQCIYDLRNVFFLNIINLIIWLLYYVIYILVHVMYWAATFLYIIHIYTHMLLSMMGAVSCRCGISISRCTSPILIFICMFNHFTFYICSRTIVAHQLMLFVDCNRLKIKLIVLYCIVLYYFVDMWLELWGEVRCYGCVRN